MKAVSVHLHRSLIVFLVPILMVGAAGCGGGSAGTGVGIEKKTFEGSAVNRAGVPIGGLKITLLQTGAEDVTDELGQFLIPGGEVKGSADFQVQSSTINAQFNVPNLSPDASGIKIRLVVDMANHLDVQNVEVLAQVRGNCDLYFENDRVIRQSNAIADGTVCQMRVEIKGQGVPLPNVPFLMQRRRCLDGAPWHDEVAGVTLDAPKAGVGRVPFTFLNDEGHCVYRVLAPYGIADVDPVITEIHTFRKQEYDDAVAKGDSTP